MSTFKTNKNKLSDGTYKPQSIFKTDSQLKNNSVPTRNESKQIDTIDIDITILKANPYQPRTKFEGIIELAENILHHGLLQPPTVFKDSNTNNYFILSGERRVRALNYLFENHKIKSSIFPVILKDIKEHEKEELALIENTYREDMTLIDLANTAYRYTKNAKSYSEIAKLMGIGKTAVSRYIKISQLNTDVKNLLNKNNVKGSNKLELLSMVEDNTKQLEFAHLILQDISIKELEVKIKKYLKSKEEGSVQKFLIETPYDVLKPISKILSKTKYRKLSDNDKLKADEIFEEMKKLQKKLSKIGLNI